MYVVFTSTTVAHVYSTIGVHLLWTIGIAHCDINLYNMLADNDQDCKIIGILNDFDLAAIMEPGNPSPSKKGWERTGTLPFIALDLLKYHDGQCKRWYRHDLESSTWCFVYHIVTSDLNKWSEGTHDKICGAKLQFAYSTSTYGVYPAWADYWNFALDWIEKWTELLLLRDRVLGV